MVCAAAAVAAPAFRSVLSLAMLSAARAVLEMLLCCSRLAAMAESWAEWRHLSVDGC